MRISDREIAISLTYFSDEERSNLLEILSSVKRNRVLEELVLLKHLNISYMQYRTMIDHLIISLSSNINSTSIKNYLKPKKY